MANAAAASAVATVFFMCITSATWAQSMQECLEGKRQRCIPACVNVNGYSQSECETSVCSTTAPVNRARWIPECRAELQSRLRQAPQMTMEGCLEGKRQRCIPTCVNLNGYSQSECEASICSPTTPVNRATWTPACRAEIGPPREDDD